MHVNKKWKEENKIIQKGFESPGRANSKETQIIMKETKLYKLKMVLIFIIWINLSTSLLEIKVELQKYKFSLQEG